MKLIENDIQELLAEKLAVNIYNTREEMGADAAKRVSAKIQELQNTQEFVNIIFASAPSQNEFLDALATDTAISWERIRAFHMDEYIGLPGDAPQSFGHFLKVRLFDKVPVHAVYYLNGNNSETDAECEHYAHLLMEYPTDIVCMGIGENGHLAFNDPHVAFFDDPQTVKVVALDIPCRQQQVNDGCFGSFGQVPETAFTLTIPTLMSSKFVFCMVPGINKAQAIQHTIEAPVQEVYPSTILRTHPQAILFIDRASAGKLQGISSL